jgi:hypothetical protein
MRRSAIAISLLLTLAGLIVVGTAVGANSHASNGGNTYVQTRLTHQMVQAAHGIIVLDCSTPVRVLSYPATGGKPRTLARFPVGNCDSNVTADAVPTPLLAQQFSSDFQRMTITFASPNGNGNQHIGYVTVSGKRVDLTPATKEKGGGGFSGPPCSNCNIESYPRFQPHSSWIYFVRRTPNGDILMKVNTAVGTHSRAAARFTRKPGSDYGYTHTVPVGASFSGDGRVVVPLLSDNPGADRGEVYLLNQRGTLGLGSFVDPTGSEPDCPFVRTLAQMYPDDLTDYCNPGQLINNDSNTTPCTANSWAGSSAVLCSNDARVYIFTAATNPSSSREKPLIPDVGRRNRDPVGSPDGSRFAFVSSVPSTDNSAASVDQLWIGSTAGGHLRKLGPVPSGAAVVGWR